MFKKGYKKAPFYFEKQRRKGTKEAKKVWSWYRGNDERYLNLKEEQVKIETALLAKEEQVPQGLYYSIKRCISVMSSMEVIRVEKIKAYDVFKSREIFLCAWEDDPEAALMWLRNEMA